ncbi:hypothetical protein [Kitasatospora sp. McL0602]|uniref:hypothetical protein n=1 Tax=Kitasatospora sp. McL0602 TaxID=3439530 RepID=UPI003F88D9FF
MNKPNRLLAAVALSGAALAVAATPAQAVGGLGQPGGVFGSVAFTLAELTSGMPMPDTDAMVENAKNSPQGQAMMQQQAH